MEKIRQVKKWGKWEKGERERALKRRESGGGGDKRARERRKKGEGEKGGEERGYGQRRDAEAKFVRERD